MQNVERRSLVYEPESASQPLLRVERRCETAPDGQQRERDWIVGYAAKFGVNSLEIDGEFVERIDPGAFGLVTERRGRRRRLETRALFNHNADMPLARYPRTLRLLVDGTGLRYEFPVPRSSYGQDLATNINDGIVAGSSFSFTVARGGDEWSVEEGRSVRTVKQIESLIDVGPVTFPAYPDADVTVAKRSFDVFRRGLVARHRKVRVRRTRFQSVLHEARASIAAYLREHGA